MKRDRKPRIAQQIKQRNHTEQWTIIRIKLSAINISENSSQVM